MYTKSKILLRLQQPKTNLVLGLPWSEFVGKKVKCWKGKKEIKSVGKDRERERADRRVWPVRIQHSPLFEFEREREENKVCIIIIIIYNSICILYFCIAAAAAAAAEAKGKRKKLEWDAKSNSSLSLSLNSLFPLLPSLSFYL